MRIALAQMSVVEGDVARNRARAGELADEARAKGATVLAFPELCFSGYDWDCIRSTTAGDTRDHLESIRSLARGITVVGGSFAERCRGRLHNTTVVVDGRGREVARYRKIHLFTLMGEEREFVAGRRTVSFRWRSTARTRAPAPAHSPAAVAGLATCYDLRFPELFRRLTYRHQVQIIFVQSAWPMPRQTAWDVLLRARAIENQVFVCGTNRVGQAGRLDYFGSTQVVSPLGEVIANQRREDGLLIAEVDLREVDRVRRIIPALPDRRPGVYGRY